MEERNDFLLKDLRCKASEVKGIFPDPSTLLLRVSFKSADLFECYSARLAAGVPWTLDSLLQCYGVRLGPWRLRHRRQSVRRPRLLPCRGHT
jgi:hypothetical protein